MSQRSTRYVFECADGGRTAEGNRADAFAQRLRVGSRGIDRSSRSRCLRRHCDAAGVGIQSGQGPVATAILGNRHDVIDARYGIEPIRDGAADRAVGGATQQERARGGRPGGVNEAGQRAEQFRCSPGSGHFHRRRS